VEPARPSGGAGSTFKIPQTAAFLLVALHY